MHPAPGGSAHWLTARDGTRIRCAVWREGRDGTVLFLNGRTEYIEKYGLAAAWFGARGLSFATLDWRGQGLSDTDEVPSGLCHVDDFSDYQQDVGAVIAHLTYLEMPQPLLLLSHSMGGAIGLRALHEGMPAKAAVFCGPMWGILLPTPARVAARLVSAAAVRLGWSRHFVPGGGTRSHFEIADPANSFLTSDDAMFSFVGGQLRRHPELSRGGPSFAWMHTSLRECSRLTSERPPRIPSLVLLGTEERIVDPKAIRSVCARWTEAELEMIDGARHELLMETETVRTHVLDRASAFFRNYS